MTIQNIQKKMTPILKRQGVLKAALFGSIARGEAKLESDIDLLVKLRKSKSLLDLVRLKLELEATLGKKVDVITYNGIHPRLKDLILKDQKLIYEERPKNIS